MHALISPSSGSTIVDKLKTYEGGTGQTTQVAALTALNGVPSINIGAINGVAALDANGMIPMSNISPDTVSVVGIEGNSVVPMGGVAIFNINNHDAFTTYNITAVNGSVVRVLDKIYYTAPAAAGTDTLTVNGRAITLTIDTVHPNQPTLLVSTAGSTNTNVVTVITGSVYSNNVGLATAANTDWQIATDNAFSNIVASSMADAVNKVSWSYTGLALNTTYYIRARYRDNAGGVSSWSTVSYTTKANYTPSVIEAELYPNDATGNERAGWSIALSSDGSRVAVGAYNKQATYASQGAIYIFLRTGTTWAFEAKLVHGDPANTTDSLGYSLSITADGTRVVAGAYDKTGTVTGQGAVYVFTRTGTTWAQEAKLIAGDPAIGDYFGCSSCISGDGTRIVIGAYNKTGTVTGQGAAYVFLRTGTTWAQEAKVLSSDPVASDNFGWSASTDNTATRIVIGAYNKTGTAGAQGAAYVFLRTGTTWAQEAKLLASDGAGLDRFGFSISTNSDGSRIAVGAYTKTVTASTQGAAYVFLRTGTAWAQEAKLVAGDAAANDAFGYSISISGDGTKILVGAYIKTVTVSTQGAAYVFSRTGTSWTQDNRIVANDAIANNRYGTSVSISSDNTRIAVGSQFNYYNSSITLVGAGYIYST